MNKEEVNSRCAKQVQQKMMNVERDGYAGRERGMEKEPRLKSRVEDGTRSGYGIQMTDASTNGLQPTQGCQFFITTGYSLNASLCEAYNPHQIRILDIN